MAGRPAIRRGEDQQAISLAAGRQGLARERTGAGLAGAVRPIRWAPAGLSSTFWIGTWYTGWASDSSVLWFAAGTGTLSQANVTTINGIGSGDPSLGGVYDGSYTVTARAYDDDGHTTTASVTTATVANTSGTEYRAGFSTTAVPQELTYDPTLQTQTTSPINVTVTNNGTSTLPAASTVLRYTWYSGDDIPVVTTSANISLPSDIAAGGHVTVTVPLTPPTLPAGIYRGRYTLRVDLFDTTNNVAFADAGNTPLQQTVTVNLATPLELGLERFQQYDGADLGTGLTSEVNLGSGNTVVSWTPFDEPGDGLDTVVDVTYNSLEGDSRSPLGNNFSLAISSLTPLGAPLDVHPNASDGLAGRTTPWIGFVDGDGSYHVFTGQTAGDGTVYWSEPAGVHLYLRQYSTTDTTRWWAITKPDRTTFFYDQQGNPTYVVDGNGNTITYTETPVAAGDDAYGATEHVTQVTDAGGRAFTIAYLTAATTAISALRGKVQSISDHLGHTIIFDYFNDGNLMRATQTGGANPDGSFTPSRSVSFEYLDPANNVLPWWSNLAPNPANWETPRASGVTDAKGDATGLSYYLPGGTATWQAANRVDRDGNTTTYTYNTSSHTTTMTLPAVTAPSGSSVSPVWTYAFDTLGRVTSITDPVNSQPTTISWTADNSVSRVTEPTGQHVDYAYNQNGYETDTWDELGNHTVLTYQNVAVDGNDVSGKWEAGRMIPHISQLIATTDPAGNLITNDGFETNTTGWTDGGTSSTTLTRDTTTYLFGAAALKATGVDSSTQPCEQTRPGSHRSPLAPPTRQPSGSTLPAERA